MTLPLASDRRPKSVPRRDRIGEALGGLIILAFWLIYGWGVLDGLRALLGR